MAATDTAGFVLALAARIEELLARLVAGRTCALVGFPSHPNPGDSAIWVGERAALRRANASVVYTCDEAIYEPRVLAERIGDGVVLIHGGGNLGDLWPEAQRFRFEGIFGALSDESASGSAVTFSGLEPLASAGSTSRAQASWPRRAASRRARADT